MINRAGNRRGLTLVEVMIAMVIMLIVFMGLIQASLLSIDSNMRNELRDEGTRVASESMAEVRAVPFNDDTLQDKSQTGSDATMQICGINNQQLSCASAGLQPTPATGWMNFSVLKNFNPVTKVRTLDTGPVNRSVRLLAQPYCRCMRVTNLDAQPTMKRVEIAATWIDPKGETHTHTVSANLRAQ